MTTAYPTYKLGELFTQAEVGAAVKLYEEHDGVHSGVTALAIAEQIVRPVLPRINQKTGQENDALYFGFWLLMAIAAARGEMPAR